MGKFARLRDLQDRLGLAYLFIAHDLAAVAYMSHVIAVMYLGKIVEIGDAATVATAPKHPYTMALFSAALPSHPEERREEIIDAALLHRGAADSSRRRTPHRLPPLHGRSRADQRLSEEP